MQYSLLIPWKFLKIFEENYKFVSAYLSENTKDEISKKDIKLFDSKNSYICNTLGMYPHTFGNNLEQITKQFVKSQTKMSFTDFFNSLFWKKIMFFEFIHKQLGIKFNYTHNELFYKGNTVKVILQKDSATFQVWYFDDSDCSTAGMESATWVTTLKKNFNFSTDSKIAVNFLKDYLIDWKSNKLEKKSIQIKETKPKWFFRKLFG